MKKLYIMIHVIKHDMNPNSMINCCRKIAPMLHLPCGPSKLSNSYYFYTGKIVFILMESIRLGLHIKVNLE